MTVKITSQLIDLNGKPFEVLMCGDQKSDKLALFLHGFPETANSWGHQMNFLAEMGYKCWAPNQRGYGKSFMPPKVSDYHMDKLKQDIADFIDVSNSKSVTLIGNDWGGAVAWIFAIQNIRPLDHLIIMNMPHPYIFQKELRKWRQLKKSWYAFLFQIPKLPEFIMTKNNGDFFNKFFESVPFRKNTIDSERIDEYRKNAIRPGGLTAMLNWYRAPFRSSNSANKTMLEYTKEKLQVPTLMIWGERDVALGIYTTLNTDKYVENLTLRYIPDAGHFVQEEAPDEVNQMMRTWLEGNEVPGVSTPKSMRGTQ